MASVTIYGNKKKKLGFVPIMYLFCFIFFKTNKNIVLFCTSGTDTGIPKKISPYDHYDVIAISNHYF